jgi:deoxyribodipyrimidine photolyase-related protein
MSQYADGGLMATKPYISSSNYLLKMSDYLSGPWQEIWDALFRRFISGHTDFFSQNPRLRMMVKNLERMSETRIKKYLDTADRYLQTF